MTIFSKTSPYKPFSRKVRLALVIISLELLGYACAQIIHPEGGPKDTVAPKILKSYPLHESSGFKGKKIKLVFDKEIQVQDIYNRLVVTPKLKKLEGEPSYTYKVRGNSLQITLESPLEEETTYTFNFNDAIKDITEGNIAADPVLTFSTGDHIDSMYVAGQISYLMTDQPASKAFVTLYKVNDDGLDIFKDQPDYFIKADDEGYFKLAHIKKGHYSIAANNNEENRLVVDPGLDEYGFLKNPIDLTETSAENITLPIVKADVREFKLQSQQPQDQYFELSFSKPVVDYTLALVRESKRFKEAAELYSNLVDDKQAIRVYNTLGLLEEDGLEAQLTAKEALGHVIEESITINFREGRSRKNPVSHTFSPASGTEIKPVFVGTMTLNKPVKEVMVDRIFFVFNGQETVSFSTEDLQLSTHRDVITFKKQLDPKMLDHKKSKEKDVVGKEQQGLVLHMAEGAFVTVEGESSKAMRYNYSFKNPKEYGVIQGTVYTNAPGFIVQLLDLDYKVLDEIRNEPNYQFNEVAPGNYLLRLLILQNKDEEWCFGNIKQGREPDPVVLYPAVVAVIANWKIEDIDFSY